MKCGSSFVRIIEASEILEPLLLLSTGSSFFFFIPMMNFSGMYSNCHKILSIEFVTDVK